MPESDLPPPKKKSGLAGSPTGQWQVPSFNSSSDSRWLIGTTLSKAIGSGSSSTSKACARAVLPRDIGRDIRTMCWAGRALRWRGAAEAGVLARPERPSRWTLPITAFLVTLPSSAAIWLAESPDSQSFLSCSTRSSDQVNTVIAFFLRLGTAREGPAAMPKSAKNPSTQNPLALAGREKRARTFTQDTRTQGIKTAARDVVPDKENATIWRDSRARVRLARPHVPCVERCKLFFHRPGI